MRGYPNLLGMRKFNMFTEINGFESLNSVNNLLKGNYQEITSLYQNEDGSSTAILKEFSHEDTQVTTVCDLIIVLPNNDILFRDFMLIADGTWRDSYGGRATTIDELLPGELMDMRLVSRKNSKFTLSI